MKILKFDSIDSTNTYGKSNFENLEDKAVIISDEQTQGRGRFNRTWISQDCDNIYLSLILKPEKKDYLANLTQYMSVIAAKTIETYNVAPQIKWPNDVMINNKKVCGILCEGVIKNNKLSGVVLGIGINLNANEKILEIINKPATSLNIETGKKIDKDLFLKKFLDNFFENYENAIQKGFESFEQDYIKYTNFLKKTVFIQQRDNDTRKECTAKAIDKNGNLIVLTENNEQEIIYSGDLIY